VGMHKFLDRRGRNGRLPELSGSVARPDILMSGWFVPLAELDNRTASLDRDGQGAQEVVVGSWGRLGF
jgi:hypothetical protein